MQLLGGVRRAMMIVPLTIGIVDPKKQADRFISPLPMTIAPVAFAPG